MHNLGSESVRDLGMADEELLCMMFDSMMGRGRWHVAVKQVNDSSFHVAFHVSQLNVDCMVLHLGEVNMHG